MADATKIVFDDSQMASAASKIEELSTKYASAGTHLGESFTSAVKDWEGASKDKMVAFINGSVKEYTVNTVPQLLKALSELLKANSTQMQKVDQEIASNIPN